MEIYKDTAKTFDAMDNNGVRHLLEMRTIKKGARVRHYINGRYTEKTYTDVLLAYSDFAAKRGELKSSN